jgi:hypothetical protein
MNTQNILKYFGTKLDIRLDSSEFYDYEISKVEGDYDTDVIDLTQPILYDTLKISDTLEDFSCVKDTITLIEFDNRINDPLYVYSGFSTTVTYDTFVDWIGLYHKNLILNNDIYIFELGGVEHFFRIGGYNNSIYLDERMGESEVEIIEKFKTDGYLKCSGKLNKPTACCGITPKYAVKPWAYQFIQPEPNECTSPIIERRTEKGWTLDFIFNRESLPWSSGSKFYFFGTRGPNSYATSADSILSFGFTSDRRIQWTATRYSGYCDPDSGYTESFYVDSDVTTQLCTTGGTKDFNITIVFDRYKRFTECDIENHGGWNDLLGWEINDYTDLVVTAITSTQIATYEKTNELLNKKWSDERQRRLGVLKIYLNGRPIYKKEDWEEVVPSNRGSQPFIQSWGGDLNLNPDHNGICCFNMKSIKYYEEPLDYLHVRHNFITRLNQYDFFICGVDCKDELIGYFSNPLFDEEGDYLITDNNDVILY